MVITFKLFLCFLNLRYIYRYWRRKWQPTPVVLPGKFRGWRRLVGYSPWGHKESDTTDFTFFLSIVSFGEGNGNPLQCSCLENPMDGGAWWAAVYGVAKSRTRLSDFTSLHFTHCNAPNSGFYLFRS